MSTLNSATIGRSLFLSMVCWLCLAGDGSAVRGQPVSRRSVFDEARQLEQDEQPHAAFVKYLSEPGGEFAAVQLARAEAGVYLKLLEEHRAAIPEVRRRLVEAELLLALRRKDEALKAFREVASKIALKDGDGWKQGLLPRTEYFVDPPNSESRGWGASMPFSVGPGSHRDNWLLRRLIALEAWDDAAKEFARVWELHREMTQPFVVQLPTEHDKNLQPTKFERRLVRPAGFNGSGLQFALDYAFFLQRQERMKQAQDVLIETALRIDMDRDPNHVLWREGTLVRKLKDDEQPGQGDVPNLRPVELVNRGSGIGVSRASFLRLAFGFLKTHGREKTLEEELTKRIATGENRLRRVLAQVRLLQGEPAAATQIELDYIAAAKFDPLSTAYRRGEVFESAQKVREAATEFETALSLLEKEPPRRNGDKAASLWDFPDPAEPEANPDRGSQRLSQRGLSFAGYRNGGGQREYLQSGLLSRLERLYSALSDTDKSLDVARRQLLVAGIIPSIGSFDELERKHRAVKKSDEFTAWAKEQVSRTADHNLKANLQWLIGDRSGAAESFAKASQKYDVAAWKDRFRAAGPEPLRMFLKALIAADPKDSQSQLELFELDGLADGAQRRERLELLLEVDPRTLFWRGKGGRRNELPFQDQFEIAYRLMRLYEQAKEFDKLQSLGVRIARGEKPFDLVNRSDFEYRDRNGLPESANAALAVAIQHADTQAKLSALAVALEKSQWSAARTQLQRKLDQSKAEPPPAFGWANLPAGVRLIVSNENVLSLTHDDRHVYAGHPWGVAVYDLTGKPITRIALGEAALTMATTVGESDRVARPESSKGVAEQTTEKTSENSKDGQSSKDHALRKASGRATQASGRATQEHFLWVGTPKGLFRIARKDWSVAHQWMHDWMLSKDRHKPFGSEEGFPHSAVDDRVNTLTVDGDELWIGQQRTIQRLNTKTLALRAFTVDELKVTSWADCERIVLDGRYVWADSSHSGLRRYDRETDEWSVPDPPNQREPVRLVEVIDGKVFGDVWVNDPLRHRLCLIDRQTLALTVIPLTAKKEEQLINSPLSFFGRVSRVARPESSKGVGSVQGTESDHALRKASGRATQPEQLVFGTSWPGYLFDEAAGSMKPMRSVVEQLNERIRGRAKERTADESLASALAELDRTAEFSDLFGRSDLFRRDDGSSWQSLTLPGGTRVLGARQDRVRFEYPTEERGYTRASAHHETKDREGGLFFVKPNGPPVRVSSALSSNSILGDQVREAVSSPQGTWLCTSLGVAWLDREAHVRDRFTRANGLCSNRVTGAVELLGKTYFSTAWGDSGGGLAIFDPTTSIFTSINHEDGLPTDKLESLQVAGDKLRLNFGVEYLRHNAVGELRYRQFGPTTFDPQTNTVAPGGEAKLLQQNEAEGAQWKAPLPKWMPYLGGFATKSTNSNGRTLLCGTRGVVLFETAAVAEPKFAELGAKLVQTGEGGQLADAEKRPVKVSSPNELAQALRDENPLYRANAIASLLAIKPPLANEYLPLVANELSSRNKRLRATALYFVTKFKEDAKVVPLLKARLTDSDKYIRVVATVDLARRGQLSDEKFLAEVFRSQEGSGLHNYPFGAKSSVGVIADRAEFLKALAPHATPAVFRLWLQFPARRGDEEKEYFPQFGISLRRDPASADVLLKAHDTEEWHTEQRDLARDLFQAAGRPLLPRLHAALKSDDRVVRSNAARACGAIADPSSLQPLLKAVDLESGLSRASIVWALGQLKSPEALPVLAQLYAEAKSDQQRQLSGHRIGQQAAVVTSQYQRLANLEALTAEWTELKSATLASPADPRRQEELLKPEHILEAIAQIGPERSQPFYRALAANADPETRVEAVQQLAAANAADRPENLTLLKNLLKDEATHVRVAAAVSLILLKDLSGQPVILDALKSRNPGDKYHGVHQLDRLKQPQQLDFAKESLKSIANDRTLVAGLREFTNNLLKRTNP